MDYGALAFYRSLHYTKCAQSFSNSFCTGHWFIGLCNFDLENRRAEEWMQQKHMYIRIDMVSSESVIKRPIRNRYN